MYFLVLFLATSVTLGENPSNNVDKNIKSKIDKMFEEDKNIVIGLGKNNTRKVKKGKEGNFPITAKTYDGSEANRGRLKYKITASEYSTKGKNCLDEIGKEGIQNLIGESLNKWEEFDSIKGSTALFWVDLDVKKDIPKCDQKFYIDVRDNERPGDKRLGSNYFQIKITEKKNLFEKILDWFNSLFS